MNFSVVRTDILKIRLLDIENCRSLVPKNSFFNTSWDFCIKNFKSMFDYFLSFPGTFPDRALYLTLVRYSQMNCSGAQSVLPGDTCLVYHCLRINVVY